MIKLFFFYSIDNCAIWETTLASASWGQLRFVTIWSPIAIVWLCRVSIEFESGGRPKWPGVQNYNTWDNFGKERRGSDSIWFDLNRMEGKLTERAMQKCCSSLQRDTFVAARLWHFYQQLLWLAPSQRTGSKLTFRKLGTVWWGFGGTWMQSRWTMLPGLTISWPALEKQDNGTFVAIIGGLSEDAIIYGNNWKSEVDDTSQGSRDLQSLQTQSGEGGSQGSLLCKSWTLS